MDVYSSRREVEKPKRTKTELRTIMRIEARSHANTMEALADALELGAGRETPACDALRKGARFLRHLTL